MQLKIVLKFNSHFKFDDDRNDDILTLKLIE